ncbi:diaminopropionate ammonia-lyase [Mesorhizobium captivum]|uniref:diaminopropionate ammonia-lyase n=1 Tax=Mesorhizobium captivum TaxID=3072319 RepID=UPI002A24ACD3|nr:diaminopropionate ammonia-lyase [Mesorhizobium sp. VK22E]MDX8507476.1 diaminopropionate ammonia-lyase [Mesorhizobium sp. VK22E]
MESSFAHFANPRRLSPEAEERAASSVANLSGWERAVGEIRSWPEYGEQPLHSLAKTARRLGLGELFFKDESQRFGRQLGSFKALGAPYAVSVLLADAVENETGRRPTSAQLRTGEFREITGRITVCVATDGNQGKGLAFAAKTFGCRCVVYIHGHVSAARKDAMEAYGAIVIRVDGEYEASVNRAKEDARMNGWSFVSSTSWDDYRASLPRNVMSGYMVMVEEAIAQVPSLDGITHVFMAAGVGSIPAAVFLGIAQRLKASLPRFVVVEPSEADCCYQSAKAGGPTPSAGTLRTIMAGLACREVSPAAWTLLDWLVSDFVTIPDDWAEDGMRALADGGGDVPIVCGESAAGSTGILIKCLTDDALKRALGLDASSRVLLFGCEGATDPGIYTRIVGSTPEAVFDRQGGR